MLIIARAFPGLARFLLREDGVSYVLPEKVSQDKLEGTFGNVRQMKGGNEAPDVSQVNSQMNVLRTRTSQDMKVLRGNTAVSKRRPELEPVDNTPLPKKGKILE